MSGISGVGSPTVPARAAVIAATARPIVQATAAQSQPANAGPSKGIDADGDHDGGKIDVTA